MAASLPFFLSLSVAHEGSLPINPTLGVPGYPDCARMHPDLQLGVEDAAVCASLLSPRRLSVIHPHSCPPGSKGLARRCRARRATVRGCACVPLRVSVCMAIFSTCHVTTASPPPPPPPTLGTVTMSHHVHSLTISRSRSPTSPSSKISYAGSVAKQPVPSRYIPLSPGGRRGGREYSTTAYKHLPRWPRSIGCARTQGRSGARRMGRGFTSAKNEGESHPAPIISALSPYFD